MPGMGQPGVMGGGSAPPPRAGTADNPVGGPPGIVSAQQGFGDPGTLPTPDPALMPRRPATTTTTADTPTGNSCTSCGAELRQNAKFCTKCGNKI